MPTADESRPHQVHPSERCLPQGMATNMLYVELKFFLKSILCLEVTVDHLSFLFRFPVQAIAPNIGRITSLTLDQCPIRPPTVRLVVERCPQLNRLVVCTNNGVLEKPQVSYGNILQPI